jgi:glutathione S-transferase
MHAKVYVIVGSHACRTATLMLGHKRIPYRVIELPTGAHPLLVRACGFPGNSTPIRTVDGTTHRQLALLDRLGTVPALLLDGERVQTNRKIARHLERVCPDPPLLPAESERRGIVEEAERWGDEVLQMAARRLLLATPVAELRERGARGRLGPLLTRSDRLRGLLARGAGQSFRASAGNADDLLGTIPALLDKVDGWVRDEVLCGEELTVADFTIAPSLALLSYRPDLARDLASRPVARLLDRLLPEPTVAPLANGATAIAT